MEGIVKTLFSSAAIAATMLNGAVSAAELPTFERLGMPITAHQVAVLGAAGVKERSFVPAATHGGMPASPHQVAVLTPRKDPAEPSTTATVATADIPAR